MASEDIDTGPPLRDNTIDTFAADFARAIERERLTRGLTAAEASEQANIAPKTWQRLEDGKPVKNQTLVKLEHFFSLPRGTLVNAWHRRVLPFQLRHAVIHNKADAAYGNISESLSRASNASPPLHAYRYTENPKPVYQALRLAELLTIDELRSLREQLDVLAKEKHAELKGRIDMPTMSGTHNSFEYRGSDSATWQAWQKWQLAANEYSSIYRNLQHVMERLIKAERVADRRGESNEDRVRDEWLLAKQQAMNSLATYADARAEFEKCAHDRTIPDARVVTDVSVPDIFDVYPPGRHLYADAELVAEQRDHHGKALPLCGSTVQPLEELCDECLSQAEVRGLEFEQDWWYEED